MKFFLYNISHPSLKPFVQYILFNFSNDIAESKKITSFANTNICLGILKQKQLVNAEMGYKSLLKTTSVTSYLSGLYTEPHRVLTSGDHDEICIDFTPLGYYHFFPFYTKKYIIGEDVLTEAFGALASDYFERLFEESDFMKRGQLIESFLLPKMHSFMHPLLAESLHLIHSASGEIRVSEITKIVKCNEKKLYRAFTDYFDISPSDYIRIVRFRKSLCAIKSRVKSLTSVSYENGYYDQSHFIHEIKRFTGIAPGQCVSQVSAIEETVWLNIA